MNRTADYSIQGFIYQFIITLQRLLQNTDINEEIIVEGPIEDIDVITPSGIEAIQCKYHESKEKFTLSAIYKPVLQMMCHFKNNSIKNVKYRLYAHFPNETVGSKKSLTEKEISKFLISKDQELQKYIGELKGFSDSVEFLNHLEIEFGPSLADAEKAVIVSLAREGFSTEDAEELFYPNSIHRIAEISIRHNPSERKITKSDFLAIIKNKKKTAISRWTKELQSYEKYLKKRKEQLRENLNKNSRIRAIILDASFINDFDSQVVKLIEDFINRYNSKIKLNYCPLFSLICDEGKINDIWRRLNAKNISVERGIIAGQFELNHFLREPLKMVKDGKVEFKVRLCNHQDDFQIVLEKQSIDDVIVVSNQDFDFLDKVQDVNVEKLRTSEFNELRYLLSLNKNL